jgi:hypothetical protein
VVMRGGFPQRADLESIDDWYTPPEIFKALGPFGLDPCAGVDMPWRTAETMFTVEDNGLTLEWPRDRRVWLNPPYGTSTGIWLDQLVAHGRGTALIFARTETSMFDRCVWKQASALLFIRGRLRFYRACGRPRLKDAGAPSVLVAYGNYDADRLQKSGIAGAFIDLRKQREEAASA